LFDMLAPAELARVIGSMTPLEVPACTQIIRQGDTDAKNFYVLESGACEAFLEPDKTRHKRQKVYSYTPGT
jgi:CRP-like cAMP-binding protein